MPIEIFDGGASSGGASSNSFETHQFPHGTSPVADSATDTFDWQEGDGIELTGNASTDSATVALNRSSNTLNRGRAIEIFDDFDLDSGFGSDRFAFYTTGGGIASLNNNAKSIGHPGIISLSTAGSATSHATLIRSGEQVLPGSGTGKYVFETDIQIVTLADGVQDFDVSAGFQDAYNVDGMLPTDGAVLIADRSNATSATNWVFVTANGGARTPVDTGVAVAAGSWFCLRIVVDGTLATPAAFAYINDVLVGTITATLPNTTTHTTGSAISVKKNLGSTARLVYVDYGYLGYFFPSGRPR